MRFSRKGVVRLFLAMILSIRASGTYAAATELRGFGKIESTVSRLDGLDLTVYSCETPAKAVLLQHKFGRDLQQTATVPAQWTPIKVGDITANVLTIRSLSLTVLRRDDDRAIKTTLLLETTMRVIPVRA